MQSVAFTIIITVLALLNLGASAYIILSLIQITKHLQIPSKSEEKKNVIEKQIEEKEESDKQFNNMLQELADQKVAKENAQFGSYSFDELDQPKEVLQSVSEPDGLLTLLELGLPDEELDSILKELETK